MSDPMSGEEGIVFNIQRHSVHDGPGIRTIVFLKGCPLACRWCCNPESQDFARELAYNPEKCIGCGACLQVCPEKAIRREGESLVFLRELCAACGLCAEVCYAEARVMEGWRAGAAELVEEVLKDEIFFRRSGGGLTLSGGEPLAQRDFAAAILRRAKAAGLHTAVETAGHVPWDSFLRVLPHVDLYLFDIKHADPEKHRRFIGEDNRLILENLRRLSRVLGIDDHLYVGQVGQCIQWRLGDGIDAAKDDGQRRQQHRHAIAARPVDEFGQHGEGLSTISPFPLKGEKRYVDV